MKKIIVILSGFLFYACTGDCPDAEVREVQWVTYQKIKTHTRSFIPEFEIEKLYIHYYNKRHNTNISLNIKNKSNTHTLKFRVNKKYGYRGSMNGDFNDNFTTDNKNYSIAPNKTAYVDFDINTNGDYYSKISYDFLDFEEETETEREVLVYDSIIVTKREVNTCQENAEAINSASDSVIKLYQRIARIEPNRIATDTLYNQNINKKADKKSEENRGIKVENKWD